MLRSMRHLLSFLTIFLLLIPQAASVQPVEAASSNNTFTVNSTADLPDGNVSDNQCLAQNGKCTLRAAIMQANSASGMDTILLPAGTYLLTLPGVDDNDQFGDLDISDDLTIKGAGPHLTIVDGNGAVTGDRVFHILSTAHQTALSGMTIRNGATTTANTGQDAGFGGGIYQDGGDLSLNDVVIEGNQADWGGGLALVFYSQAGTTTLERVTVQSNQAVVAGGGIYLVDTISSSAARLDVFHTTLNGNSAQQGGGIYFQGFGVPSAYLTTLALTNTTVSGNTVDHDGGGIYDRGGLVQLANVTIANNRVNLPAVDNGGVGGGGLFISSSGGFIASLNVKNSIIGDNSRGKEGISFSFQDDCNGAVTSFGFNLLQSTTNCAINTTSGDQENVDPLLGPLEYNGGLTQNQALAKGSPAIDGGNPNGCIDFDVTNVTTDQRGFQRPANGRCDIGAFEYYSIAAFIPLVSR